VSIECLMEDEDLSVNFKRDDFEALMAPLFKQFEEFFTRFQERLTELKLSFSSIELVGGSVRIPKLQETIMSVFKVTEIKKTLLFDECIAQGACIQSATVSPFMSVNSTKLKDFYPYRINLKVVNSDKVFTVVDVGSNYPTKKSINILCDTDLQLEARYDLEQSKFPVRDDFIALYDVKVKYNELKSEKSRKLKV